MYFFNNTIKILGNESFEGFFKKKYERDEKIYALITLFAYPLFYILDYFVVKPELRHIFLLIRLGGAFVILMAFILCMTKIINYVQLMYAMKITIISGVNLMFIFLDTKDMLCYNINFCTLYLAASFIAPWKPRHSCIIVAIDFTSYLLACAYAGLSFEEQILSGRLIVLTCSAFYILQMYVRHRNLILDYEKQTMLIKAYKALTDKNNWINSQYHQLVIYKESLDATSDGILILNLNLDLTIRTIHYVNKNFIRFTGFDGKDIDLVKPLFLRKKHLDFDGNLKELTELSNKKILNYEIEYIHKNGSRMLGDISMSILKKGQTQLHLIAIIRDVTIKKMIQQKVVNQKFKDHLTNMTILTETLEKERSRFSEDLHEGIGQMLTTAKVNLNCFLNSHDKEKNEVLIQNTVELLITSINEISLVAFNLVPPSLREFGLAAAVEELCLKWSCDGQCLVDFKTNLWKKRLSKNIEIHVWRLIQEVTNILFKKPQPFNGRIELLKINRYVILCVGEDNFSLIGNDAKRKLKNIRVRSAMLNGRVYVFGKPDVEGTYIEVVFNQDQYHGSRVHEG
jgi:PAS domain S-box-containing protein